jgi:sugar lactone lactonase YvrE
MYVADLSNHKIRKITTGAVVTTFAGSGVGGATDATGTSATFNLPSGVAVDSSGNVSIADWSNQKIRVITPAGVVTTLAGCAGTCATGGADGTGAAASFNGPQGNAVDSAGNIFVAEGTANKIRKITPAGVVTTFAGCAAPTSPCAAGSANGTGTAASFSTPTSIAIDSANNLYVVDGANNKIRKITPAAVVTTFAGSGAAGSADGTGTAATFNLPTGLAIDSSGNVYVVDASNRKIRRITPAGVVTTVAGAGSAGGADGIGSAASFNFPYGIAVDATGNLYVADYSNSKIRKID